MALQDLLNLSTKRKKIGLSEERINAIKPELRQYIAYWREYPDMFIDFLQDGGDDTRERKFNSQVVYPIIAQGDTVGSIILLSKDATTKMGDVEMKVIQSAAGFLGSQMDV